MAWLTDYCVRQFSAIKPECNVLHVRNWIPFKCFNKSNCLFRGEKKTKKKNPKWNITLKWANKPQNTSSSRKSFDKSQNFRQKKRGKEGKKVKYLGPGIKWHLSYLPGVVWELPVPLRGNLFEINDAITFCKSFTVISWYVKKCSVVQWAKHQL